MRRRDVLATGMLAGALATTAAAGSTVASAATKRGRTDITVRDGTKLFVREWGEGQPVLFIHAWALDSTMWQQQFIELGDNGFRCISFDRRGHGRSGAPPRGYDLDTLSDDIARVVDAHDLQNFTLVAHSMGGGEAIRYCARHGTGKVRNVILIGSQTPFLTKTADNPFGAPPEYFAGSRRQWTADFAKWIEANKKPFFTADTSIETMDWLARKMGEGYLPALLACNKAITSTDLRPDLTKIDKPTLVIHGDKDASAPLELTGKRTAAGITGARLKIYEGAPHGLFLTHARQLNADIMAFARS